MVLHSLRLGKNLEFGAATSLIGPNRAEVMERFKSA
jgi:hypothetical protein